MNTASTTRRPSEPMMRAGIRSFTALSALAVLVAACSGSSAGAAAMPLGTEAVIAYTAPASGATPAVDTTLGVTVVAVRTGTQEQLTAAGMQVDDESKDAVPYYVDVRYANKGAGALTRNL